MDFFLKVLPLLVILFFLFRKRHMLVAGFAGGLLAVIIGGLSLATVQEIFLDGVSTMLGITVPILYAATAAMIAEAGSIKAVIDLSKKVLRGHISILAGILVLIQAVATYMAGLGAGNTMVTAPLIAVAVGAVPEVIAGMAIATAAGFTTSPASTETAVTAQNAGLDTVTHAANMRPFTILIFLLGAGLAIYGVYKRGSLVFNKDENNEDSEIDSNKTSDDDSYAVLIKKSLPALALLIMVVAGSQLNTLIGLAIFNPATAVIITTILTVLLTDLNTEKTSEALIDGSKFILTTLFSIGIFLSFINLVGEIGAFEAIAGLAGNVPEAIVLPVSMIIAFLIAIPSGAFAAGVLTLVLPTLSNLGFQSLAMGFIAISVGLGTQVSPVQINVAALAEGFEMDIMDIIKYNLKFVIGTMVMLLIVSFFVI